MLLISNKLIDFLLSVFPLSEPFEIGEDRPHNNGSNMSYFAHDSSQNWCIIWSTQNSIDDGHKEALVCSRTVATSWLLRHFLAVQAHKQYQNKED